MAEVPAGLAGTLQDRYLLERVLGEGGMATVYLARDLKHGRDVALKVLRPELAVLVGRDRFLAEISTTAKLRHPHILPLYDSGEAGGFLFYVMPVIEGESLRARLTREKQLPLGEALRVAGEVAEALAYAHEQGIVHRDIKPENILLERGHAIVADFGIAQAVRVEGSERLTETGMSLGTPLYMSPEQVAGQRDLDARSDLYSLGCVVYEMLAGEPPFTGPTAHVIAARRLTDPVPSVRALRETVSPVVEAAIARAMAKVPADRFASTREFAAALSGKMTTERQSPWGRGMEPAVIRRSGLNAAVLLMVAVVAVVLWSHRPKNGPPLDPNLIAVFPFRVTGTDTSYTTLRDGMVDLFETIFSGEGGPRVLSSRTALATWRHATTAAGEEPSDEAAAKLARGLGAGSLVLGSLVATPGHLSIKATLLDAKSGAVRAEAKVEGLPDSLEALGDALADRLIAASYGMKPDRLAKLATTSLAALYAYLQGRAVYRTGNYDSATKLYDRAIELDSTFALAALGYGQAGAWADWGPHFKRLALARKHADRLSTRDRLMLDGLSFGGSPRDHLDKVREAVAQVPDDPDLWTQLGDRYFHDGALVGVTNPNDSAAWALKRAMALDTIPNVEPTIHLLQIAAVLGDTDEVRHLLDRFGKEANNVTRLLAAVSLGDTAMIALARKNLRAAGGGGYGMMMDAQLFGLAIPDAEYALQGYLAKARTAADTVERYGFDASIFYHNLGRPVAAANALSAAFKVIRRAGNALPWWRDGVIQVAALYNLYGEADSATTAEAVRWLTRLASAPPATDPEEAKAQFGDLCVLTRWRLSRGDTTGVGAAMTRLEGDKNYGNDCSILLRALVAAVTQSPDTDATLRDLEQLMAPGRERWEWSLDIARLREARGDLAAALRWTRARPGYLPPFVLAYPLREEGRLAALTGDTAGAIRAYSHYLALRYNPEPSVKLQVDSVRAELAKLVRER